MTFHVAPGPMYPTFLLPTFFLLTCLTCEAAKTCKTEQEIRGESGSESLKTWPEVYASYKAFRQCDDAAVAEGYSASVARVFSTQWETIGQLNRMVSHDRCAKRLPAE
jgi:hypothetical protein